MVASLVCFTPGLFGRAKAAEVPARRAVAPRWRGGRTAAIAVGAAEDKQPGEGSIVNEEDMVDDDDYIVVDGKDLNSLLSEMIERGRDGFENVSLDDEAESGAGTEYEQPYSDQEELETAESVIEAYKNRDTEEETKFDSESIEFLPRWAQEKFRKGEWEGFVKESELTNAAQVNAGSRSLDALPDGEVNYNLESLSIEQLAVDYRLPMEYVIQEMFQLGAGLPMKPDDRIADLLETEQITRLVEIVTSFDAADLDDKYSDDTLEDIAYEYDVGVQVVINLCEAEDIYLCFGSKTHLQKNEEELIIDHLEGMLGL